jgi:membrane-bound serine protease (ClpP class)
MRASTTIGDCAPIAYSGEGPKMLGEKYQSPLRATFRSLAKRNGFPQVLAEAMVTEGMAVYRLQFADSVSYVDSLEYADLAESVKKAVVSKKTVVGSGELLTMDDVEAVELGFSRGSVASLEELADMLGVARERITHVEQNWSETFVRFLTLIAPLLMLVGFAGLYIEMRTPGFGWPGGLGLACLALAFLGQHMVGLADYTELLLLGLGIVLLAVEVFVTPGFGLMGFAGLGLIAIGMVLSMQGFVLPTPSAPWQMHLVLVNFVKVLSSFLLSFILSLLFVRYVLPRVGAVVNGPYLAATLGQAHVDSDSIRTVSAGTTGVVVKPLRPAGKVRVGEEVYDMVTEGDFLESGAKVEVIRVEGNRIVVGRKGTA